jgi:methyl-accepting chemotaxis protein
VEEQTANTIEMNRSLVDASAGVSQIAEHIGGHSQPAGHDTDDSLRQLAAELQTEINKFSL